MLLIQDQLLPQNRYAACYIDAFEKLRDYSHHRAYSETEWITMLEGTGFTVVYKEEVSKKQDLLIWAGRQGCSPRVVECLESMLRMAPKEVLGWLNPSYEKDTIIFDNRHIILMALK
jgi:hypothetical protein